MSDAGAGGDAGTDADAMAAEMGEDMAAALSSAQVTSTGTVGPQGGTIGPGGDIGLLGESESSPAGGGGLTPNTPVTPVVAETPKSSTAPKIERKRRRRSLLTQEEGGLSEDGSVQRRSILGR